MLQRVLDVSAQLQQSQADMMASQRQTADLQKVVDESNAKVDSLEKIREQLTQVRSSVLSMRGQLMQAEISCSACRSRGTLHLCAVSD